MYSSKTTFSFYFALMVEEELVGYRSAIHHKLPDDDTTSDPKFCNRALARVQKTIEIVGLAAVLTTTLSCFAVYPSSTPQPRSF